MFNLIYEFKLKPTAAQVVQFEGWLEQCRRVYNYALRERKDWYNSRSCRIDSCSLQGEYIIPVDIKRPTFASQCKGLTQARKAIPQLHSLNAQVLQQVLKRLEVAFVAMWERGHGFPRFKKQGRMRSFVFPQLGVEPIANNRVKLPKIGLVKFKQTREIPADAKVKQARVVKRASGWYVQLTLQWNVLLPEVMPHGNALGIDVGLSHFAAVSNGRLFPNPRPFKRLESKLRSLQKKVSRKQLGSSNRKKAQLKVSKLHERIEHTSHDTHQNFKYFPYFLSMRIVFISNIF